MASGGLTSHHVNYLIWRYLQESGHGEAAVMLQRAWNPDPQNLPFAQNIKTHALVSLVQKGLQYHELEQLVDREGKPATSPPVSFFGQSAVEPGPPRTEKEQVQQKESDVVEEESLSPKSIAHTDSGLDQAADGAQTTTAVTGRRSIGSDENVTAPNANEMSMYIDKPVEPEESVEHSPTGAISPSSEALVVDADGDVDMAEPPIEDLPSPVYTLSMGQSVGVQIVPPKAADLTPETVLVDMPGPGHVTKTCWRPNDPLTFVAAGDTVCGLWKLSGQRSSTAPTFQSLVENIIVTALDWDQTGQTLAVATYKDYVGTVTTFDRQGDVISVLPDAPRLITGLRWANRGSRMVLALSDGQRSSLTSWDQELHLEDFPTPQDVDGPIYDVAWSDDDHLYACGDGSVYQCQIDDNVEVFKRFNSGDSQEPWPLLKTTSWSGAPVAVVASTSTANIWIPTHDISASSAHDGDITAIDIRPQSTPNATQEEHGSLTLATASMDHTVKVWSVNFDAKELHCMRRLYLGESSPALVTAFSPDGYAIATASQRQLFIWNAERGGTPLATWAAPEEEKVKGEPNQDQSPTANGSDSTALDRTLSWDSDGKKLAFGIEQKMAIVNFQR